MADTITIEPVLPLPPVIVESQYQKELRESEEALPQILRDIRYCESRNIPDSENKHSTASGLYAYLNSTWANYGGYARAKDAPVYIQNKKALETYNQQGTRPWNASKSCWQPNVRVASNSYGQVTILDSGKSAYFNCVQTVRMFRDMPQTANGRANTTPINSQVATAGAIAVFKINHVGLVVKDNGDGTILIKDGNYRRGYLTQRIVSRNELKGFYI